MPAARTDNFYSSSARRMSTVFSYCVFGLGLWGLIGWKFVAQYLDSRTIKLVVMAPVACILYILAGVALWAFQEQRGERFRLWGTLCCILVLIISGVSLANYYLDLNIGLEPAVLQLLQAQNARNVLFEAVITARIGLFVIAAAILLLLQRRAVWQTAAHIAILIVGKGYGDAEKQETAGCDP